MRPTCPCGRPEPYEACCGPYHRGEAAPPTAERLLRARYSAFARGDMDYLLDTWDPATRPAALRDDPTQVWTGLEIGSTTGGGLFDVEATVAYRARYELEGRPGSQSEVSRFVRAGGRWFYVDGS